MALLWVEGFEGFGTTVDAAPTPTGVYARKYSAVNWESYFRVKTGRWTGYALGFTDQSNYVHSPTAMTTNATIVIGFAVKFSSVGDYKFLSFYDDATEGVNIRLTAAGEIAAYRASTLLGTSSGAGILANTWYYLEIKVYCHNTAGTVTVKKDTVSILALTSKDTLEGAHSYHNAWRILNGWGHYPQFDDLYFLDASGSAPQNDFLGVKQVVTIFPNAAGDQSQWTPSAGSNYDCVNDVVMDDDGTYVQTAGAGNLDLYNFEDVPATGMDDDVVGIQINTDARRTQATSYSLYQPGKLSGTQSDGSAVTVDGDSFATKTRVMATDPLGAAWTLTNLASTQFGLLLG